MDLETENRIASILMTEAAELRRQAEKEGVHVYLRQPNVRGRPNTRFLSATVLGVQQANQAVEVNEMWRVRQKEIELDERIKGKQRDSNYGGRGQKDSKPVRSSIKNHAAIDIKTNTSCSSSKRVSESSPLKEDEGLRDEELEEFLHSRVKRGRGAVGSRMDETGPYLPLCQDSKSDLPTSSNMIECRLVYGPEKPSSLRSYDSFEGELDDKGPKKARKNSSDNQHSRKQKSKEKSDKKKRKKVKKSKHHHS